MWRNERSNGVNRRDIFKLFGGAAAIPAVKSVEMLEMKPDDVLVVKVNEHISQEAAERLRALCEIKLPGRTIMVIDKSVDLEVLRKA